MNIKLKERIHCITFGKFAAGNLYAQNWQSLMDIVWEEDEEDDEGLRQNETKEMNPLVKAFLPKNATVLDLVKGAEDFFVSMGIGFDIDVFENSLDATLISII